MSDARKIQDSEEFILNIVAVITNLSYFDSPDNQILGDVESYSKRNILKMEFFYAQTSKICCDFKESYQFEFLLDLSMFF